VTGRVNREYELRLLLRNLVRVQIQRIRNTIDRHGHIYCPIERYNYLPRGRMRRRVRSLASANYRVVLHERAAERVWVDIARLAEAYCGRGVNRREYVVLGDLTRASRVHGAGAAAIPRVNGIAKQRRYSAIVQAVRRVSEGIVVGAEARLAGIGDNEVDRSSCRFVECRLRRTVDVE